METREKSLRRDLWSMRVKAILFDLGGTLIDATELYETFHRILLLKGIKRSSREVEKAMREAESELKEEFGDDVPKDTNYYVRWNLNVLHRLRVHDRDSELAEEIDKHWFDYMEIKPHTGLHSVLNRLADSGVKLGIITNGYESDLDKILPKLALENFFDILVAADTIEKKKPDPEIFLYAIKKLNVSPSEAVFVGDEYKIDYVGAEKAGLIPFLFEAKGRRKEKNTPHGINVVHSLPELLSRIDL
jgi:putative hydrolase of the HAD superfamily